MTDTRLAETDASRYATRRARRAAERQQELAALAANEQGPSPISQPVPVVDAQLAPAFAEPEPVVEASPSFADLFGFGEAEAAVEPVAPASASAPAVAIEAPVLDLRDASPVDIGELVAELASIEPDEDAPRDEPKHRVKGRKHRAAPRPKSVRDTKARAPRTVRVDRTDRPAVKAAAKPARRRRGPARIVLSGFALVTAAGLALAMSVPASMFGTPVALTSDAKAAAAAPVAASNGILAGQSVSVGDGSLAAAASTIAAARGDNFSAQTYADVVRAQYAGQLFHATFVPTAGAIRWPFSYPVAVSAPYGYSSQYAFGWHDGVDFIPGYGAPVSAIASGVVIWVGEDGALGYCVRIQHNVGGHTVVSIYGHMISGSSDLYPGESIKVGQQVGLTGQTGEATGPHLHLGLTVDGQYTDPYVWLTLNATNAK